MLDFWLVLGGWSAVTVVLLLLIRADYRRGEVSNTTAVLLWPWHALNYAVLLVAAVEGIWSVDLPLAAALVSGTVLVLIGVVIIGAGFIEFRSVRRLTGTQMDRVIDSGVYRYTRHPQYVGIIFTLLGTAVLGRSLAALAFAGILSAGLVLYLPTEEEYAERSLGEPYRRYKARTPRLFGPPRGSG